MDICLELAPRELGPLLDEARMVRERLPKVTAVNVPEKPLFGLRSLEACRSIRPLFPRIFPQVRAVDIDLKTPLPLGPFFTESGIDEVVVIAGDPAGEPPGGDTLGLIRKFKRELPGIKIYAALDPYRGDPRKEVEYADAKLDAGALGFFTQPFFGLGLLDAWMDRLGSIPVFWGLSPVLSDPIRRYWERRNLVLFPADFQPTLEWNRSFIRSALARIAEKGGDACVMPIKAPLLDCFEGIL